MTKLTKSVQNCGLHDCTHNCFAITEKEALAAIEVMREAFIDAVADLKPQYYGFSMEIKLAKRSAIDEAIEAIKEVK